MKKEIPRDEFIRKRMERQRRIRKRRLIIFFIFFIITAVCVGITLSLTVFFPIEKINITGSKIYTSEEILKFSNIEKGENIFTLSEEKEEKPIRLALHYVEKIAIERNISGTLDIIVTDAKEFICYDISGRYFTVSKSGWVLKETAKPPEKLIRIKTKDIECSVGTEIDFKDNNIKSVIEKIISETEKEKINLNVMDVTDTLTLKIKVENRFIVDLGKNDNLDKKIKHLSGMIKSIPSEKSGNINLSMWTTTNTQGTFMEKKSK